MLLQELGKGVTISGPEVDEDAFGLTTLGLLPVRVVGHLGSPLKNTSRSNYSIEFRVLGFRGFGV